MRTLIYTVITYRTCPLCRGTGAQWGYRCALCHGNGKSISSELDTTKEIRDNDPLPIIDADDSMVFHHEVIKIDCQTCKHIMDSDSKSPLCASLDVNRTEQVDGERIYNMGAGMAHCKCANVRGECKSYEEVTG